MNTPIASTAPSRTIAPSATSERAPMKQLSSMITGPACSGSSTPPMPGAAGDVALLADLRAGADGRPGVDHGVAVDVGAEVDEARHQHHAGRDVGRVPHHAARHGAEAGAAEARFVPAVEFRGHLVPPHRLAGTARDHAHVVEPEREQHRLLEPLVDAPVAVAGALGHARLAAVEEVERSSTASRVAPLVAGLMPSRCSKASSMVLASWSWDMAEGLDVSWRRFVGGSGVRVKPRIVMNVGWVERSDTHRLSRHRAALLMGFAALNPSYEVRPAATD